MGEFQNSVQNKLAAIIGFSQREKRASWQFEDAACWCRNSMRSHDEGWAL